MNQEYTQEQLNKIGHRNYELLVSYCKKLEDNGFWERVEKVTNTSCVENLDLYIQSSLISLADSCDEILQKEREFILGLTDSNPLEISEENQLSDEMFLYAKRVAKLPPILIQLCGLYDNNEQGDLTKYFIDAYLNILMCMSFFNKENSIITNKKIENYFYKIESFVWLSDEQMKGYSDYVRKKIENPFILGSAKWLISPEEGTKGGASQANYRVRAVKKFEKPNSDERDDLQGDANSSDNSNTHAFGDSHVGYEFGDKDALDENGLEKEANPDVNSLDKNGLDKDDLDGKSQFLKMKQRIMKREKEERRELDRRVEKALSELNNLVGLEEVKEEVRSLINLIKIRNMRARLNMPLMDMSYHMVFTGAPGTGKTTVARIIARVYKELGILSEGKLIETDRSGLVAGYVGQTAINVRETVESAVGGVLFIDEAYALASKNVPNDFGAEAIDTLVKLMEDHRDNLVIIVAGYTDEMKYFLDCNTGLKSRFNKFIEFKDYSTEELVEILLRMAENSGFILTDEAVDAVKEIISSFTPEYIKSFGNARGIRNMFEKIVVNQANRIIDIELPEKETLMTIEKEDVEYA